jgi:hypothetical protein
MIEQETSINLLRNLATVLESLHEKTEVPMDFCVKAIQVLNVMSYKAIPAVRMKIKDMSLMENRNLLVIRCLLNSTEDIYARIAAILEIHRSFNERCQYSESKILKESQVLICILSMFIEITDDLEYMTTSLKRRRNTNNHHHHHHHQPEEEDFNERCQLAINLQIALIQIISTFTTSSTECRKTMIKLLTNFGNDQIVSSVLLGAFIKNYKAAHISAAIVKSFPITDINDDIGKSDGNNVSLLSNRDQSLLHYQQQQQQQQQQVSHDNNMTIISELRTSQPNTSINLNEGDQQQDQTTTVVDNNHDKPLPITIGSNNNNNK